MDHPILLTVLNSFSGNVVDLCDFKFSLDRWKMNFENNIKQIPSRLLRAITRMLYTKKESFWVIREQMDFQWLNNLKQSKTKIFFRCLNLGKVLFVFGFSTRCGAVRFFWSQSNTKKLLNREPHGMLIQFTCWTPNIYFRFTMLHADGEWNIFYLISEILKLDRYTFYWKTTLYCIMCIVR